MKFPTISANIENINSKDLNPTTLAQALKDQEDNQLTRKMKEMEASNLRLIQLLNQKQFKEDKIKGAIKETTRKIESLKAESKDATRQGRIQECEQVEAQILMTNESYKLLEVEKKRMEVIIQALIKNPANNSEYTNMMEQ